MTLRMCKRNRKCSTIVGMQRFVFKINDTHLLNFFVLFLFLWSFFLSTLHFDIMQYRRAKKITSSSTKYIFRTIKGCVKNTNNLFSFNHAYLSKPFERTEVLRPTSQMFIEGNRAFMLVFDEQDGSLPCLLRLVQGGQKTIN